MGERNISLKWLSRPGHTGDRYLFPIKDAMAALRSNQGGVYILVGDAPANVSNNAVRCSTCIKDCVLKVGIAEEFRSRFGAYLKPGHAWRSAGFTAWIAMWSAHSTGCSGGRDTPYRPAGPYRRNR
jgi:hypothetical protein